MRRIFVFSLTLLAACTASTSGDAIKGGVKRYEPVIPMMSEVDAGPEGSSLLFTDLFNEYLGPSGRGSCKGNSQCHGTADEVGSQASGFICGDDKTECRATLLSSPLGMVIPMNPDGSFLLTIIRHVNEAGVTEGRMPRSPFTYTFSKRSIDRLRGWIAAGAKDD